MSHLQHPTAITFSPQDIQQQQEKVASQSQQVQQMQQDFQLLGGTCWKVGSSRMEVVMITIILWLLIMLLYLIICTEPPIQRWRIPGVSRGDTRQVSQTWRSEQGTWKLCSWQGKIAVAGHAQWLSATIVTQFTNCYKYDCTQGPRILPYNVYQCVSRWLTKTYQERSFNLSLTWIGSLVRWMISQPYLIFHWGRADGTRSRHRAASGAEGVAEKRSRCWANARGSVVPSLKHSQAS